jgi:hypothetical protein
VRAHPLHQLAGGGGRAGAVTEPAGQHVVDGAVATADVLVDGQAGDAVRLEGDRAEAAGGESLEHLVAPAGKGRFAVGGLTEGEQFHGGAGIQESLDVTSHDLDRIVEPAVETYARPSEGEGS